MSDFLGTLSARGLLQDATPHLAERLARGPITAYAGFDPTADSLHVGNLVPAMGLAWLQRYGGTPIVLVGGGTAMVGDPSGKRTERPVLSVEQIDRNAARISRQLARFVGFEGPRAARLVNNADWLRDLRLMDFLRDTGKHFTVGYMLQKEAIRSRLETGISFTEFSYMVVQAYDFWHLHRTAGCELQLGGTDQWGNITAGIELVRSRDAAQVHGLVLPLITTAAGAKFGKSEAGNVWLDPERTSPYQFYQFWINTDDRDAERYLKLFTFLPLDEIAEVMREQAANPSARAAQRRLAAEVTTLVHGPRAAADAAEASRALFQTKTMDVGLSGSLIDEIPAIRMPRSEFGDGISLVDALVRTGLAYSKADARRGIEGRGFYVNEEPIASARHRITADDLRRRDSDEYVILRKGKKNYVRLVVEAG